MGQQNGIIANAIAVHHVAICAALGFDCIGKPLNAAADFLRCAYLDAAMHNRQA
jgi:hypothetical protein